MKFLGNIPPPIGHEQIVSALSGIDEVDDSFSVAGIKDEHVNQWLTRCWIWRWQDGRRIFRRPSE